MGYRDTAPLQREKLNCIVCERRDREIIKRGDRGSEKREKGIKRIHNMASSSRMGPGGGLMQLETPVASGTTTATQTPPEQAVLHLRGAEPGAETGRRIQWADDVVDNEKMGKKKSKGLSPAILIISQICFLFCVVGGNKLIVGINSMLYLSCAEGNRRE